jgi:hAT family C-terminal dimerisation region
LLNELRDDECFEDQQMNNNKLLSYYLGSMEDDRIDIPEYWRRNATAYPTLAMMPRDVFAVPVSTVPFESYFSSTNRILTDKRTKLGSKFFEQLVCNKNWIDAENRMQHDTTFEPATSAIEAQESGTDIPLEDDSDGACDIQDNDLWYMHNDFWEFGISYRINLFIYFLSISIAFLIFFF